MSCCIDLSKEHPDNQEECIQVWRLPFFTRKYKKDKNSSTTVYRQIWCCGIQCRKTKQEWKKEEVNYEKDWLKSTLSYDLPEDVHQVANYSEIRMKLELKKNKGNASKGDYNLLKRYSGQAKGAVLISILMQLILLTYLAAEVFPKKIEPSGEPGNSTFFLRLVLVVFMKFLFDAEQNSITMTNYFVYAKKVSPFLKYTNYCR
jgi:hypothetical protein